jgi:hypothetical protein
MTQEALKLALEAFEAIPEEIEGWIPDKCTDAVIAIKEALAQEQEPDWKDGLIAQQEETILWQAKRIAELIDTPPQEQKESVADDFFRMIADRNPKPFPLPQCTWVGLTDDEIDELAELHGLYFMVYVPFTEAIEAKLKEKNGYAKEKNT